MLTTQFFAMKIQRYMAEHGISESTLAKVAAKAFENGSREPERLAATGAVRGRRSSPRRWSTTRSASTCSARRARARSRSCSARGARIRELAPKPVYLRSVAFRTRRFGSFEVFSPSIPVESAPSPTAEAAAAAFEQAGIGPADVDVAQVQDTESRRRDHAPRRDRALPGRGAGGADPDRARRASADALPVNTDGGCLACGEPIGASGLRQVHEVALQLRGDAGERQIPGPARVGFTQVYGAPGVSACTVLST